MPSWLLSSDVRDVIPGSLLNVAADSPDPAYAKSRGFDSHTKQSYVKYLVMSKCS